MELMNLSCTRPLHVRPAGGWSCEEQRLLSMIIILMYSSDYSQNTNTFPCIWIRIRLLWFISIITQMWIWIHPNTVFECIQIRLLHPWLQGTKFVKGENYCHSFYHLYILCYESCVVLLLCVMLLLCVICYCYVSCVIVMCNVLCYCYVFCGTVLDPVRQP